MKNAIEISNKPENRDLGLLDKAKERVEKRKAEINQIEEEIARLEQVLKDKSAQYEEETKGLKLKLADLEKQWAAKEDLLSDEIINRYDRRIVVSINERNCLSINIDTLINAAAILCKRNAEAGRVLSDVVERSIEYDHRDRKFHYIPYRVEDLRKEFLYNKWSMEELYDLDLLSADEFNEILNKELEKDKDYLEIEKLRAELDRIKDRHGRGEIDEIKKLKAKLLPTVDEEIVFDGNNLPKLSAEIERAAIRAHVQRRVAQTMRKDGPDVIERSDDDDFEMQFWKAFTGKLDQVKRKADKIAAKFPVKKPWWYGIKGLLGGDTRTLEDVLKGIDVHQTVEFFIDLNRWIFKLRKGAKLMSTSPEKKAQENALLYLELASVLEETYASLPHELEMNLNDALFDFDELPGVIGVLPEIMKRSRQPEIRKRIEIAGEIHDELHDVSAELPPKPAPANDCVDDDIKVRVAR